MAAVIEDAYGHRTVAAAPALTAGAVSTTAVGTIAPTTSAGATPTVTFATGQSANDTRGSFTLSPVTGGGAQAAGATAIVTFTNSYAAPPASVIVQITNAAGPASATAYATSITSAGFSISTSLLVTANVYVISYVVTP